MKKRNKLHTARVPLFVLGVQGNLFSPGGTIGSQLSSTSLSRPSYSSYLSELNDIFKKDLQNSLITTDNSANKYFKASVPANSEFAKLFNGNAYLTYMPYFTLALGILGNNTGSYTPRVVQTNDISNTVGTNSSVSAEVVADAMQLAAGDNSTNMVTDNISSNAAANTSGSNASKSNASSFGWGKAATALAGSIPSDSFTIGTRTFRNGAWDLLDPFYNAEWKKFNNGDYGHLESKAGNVLSDLGVQVTKGSLANNFWWGALAGATLKSWGDTINNGWGYAWNKGAKANIDSNIDRANYMGNLLASTNTTDDLLGYSRYMAQGSGYLDPKLIVQGGRYVKDKAYKKGLSVINGEQTALNRQGLGLMLGATNIEKNRYKTAMRNYINSNLARRSDYGGPLYGDYTSDILGADITGPIEYSLANDYMINRNKQANSGSTTNMFAGVSKNMFDFGGNVQTHGANWSTGMQHIDAGSSHELNPNEGVQVGVDNQGIPNLVEEDEVIYNDYVFSRRLHVPDYKKEYKNADKEDIPYEAKVLWKYSDNTFADAAKKVEKNTGASERPEDPIALKGMESDLEILALVQEKEREKLKLQEMQEAIDNMSPEEFAALLQYMQLQQLQQQTAALQQQLMQMEQPYTAEEQMQAALQSLIIPPEAQPQMQAVPPQMAAYGGNLFKFGGSFDEFKKQLDKNGLTEMDYINYLLNNPLISDADKLVLSSYRNSDNNLSYLSSDFNASADDKHKAWADEFLKTVRKVQKLYSNKGVKISELEEAAQLKFKKDILKVAANPELATNDKESALYINTLSKGEAKAINANANNAVVTESRNQFFGQPLVPNADTNKFAVNYAVPENAPEDWKPLEAKLIENALQYDKEKGKYVDRDGNVVENPYGKYGFTEAKRDWNSYGYVNPTTEEWGSVETPTPNTSGNTDFKFTPTAEWSKDLGSAQDYENQDFYIDNYIDFIEALNKGDQGALRRLYDIGEATKSNNPEDRRGKNRYFKDGADPNNLKKEDVIGYNPEEPESGIFGNAHFTDLFGVEDAASKDKTFASKKDGTIIRIGSDRWNNLSEEAKKEYTEIDGPLTREHLRNYLKLAINLYPENWKFSKDDLFLLGISDNTWGPHHLVARRNANRYALVDKEGKFIEKDGKIQYVDPTVVDNGLYSIYDNGNPIATTDLGDTAVNTIGILGGEYNPNIAVVDGKYYNLSDEQAKALELYKVDPEAAQQYTGFEAPIAGYSVNPTYYALTDKDLGDVGLGTLITDNDVLSGKKKTNADAFPEAPWWPYAVAGGLQLAGLGYNIFSPKDYSNANALISAALEAGNFRPVEFKPVGLYLTYNPYDTEYELNYMTANARATDRAILNNAAPIGTKMAGLLANAYTSLNASGDMYRKALEYNDALAKQTKEFNKDTDKFNSEGFLKAAMANQDAATRTAGYRLEGLKSGLAMKQAIDDARTNAINAGLSGLANLAYSYGNTKWNNDLIRYGINKGVYGHAAKGGSIKRRKNKGVKF